MQNMQNMQINMLKKCTKYAENMLKICWKYAELYAKYAEYAQKYALKYLKSMQ